MSTEDVEMASAPAVADKGKGKETGRDALSTLALDVSRPLGPTGPPADPADGLQVMPWVEKYRPATLDDVVAHGDIISTSEPL